MLCYKDKTFCSSDCINTDCGRNFSPKERDSAKRWWGGDDAPIAFASYMEGCGDYIAPKNKNARNKKRPPPD